MLSQAMRAELEVMKQKQQQQQQPSCNAATPSSPTRRGAGPLPSEAVRSAPIRASGRVPAPSSCGGTPLDQDQVHQELAKPPWPKLPSRPASQVTPSASVRVTDAEMVVPARDPLPAPLETAEFKLANNKANEKRRGGSGL